MHFLASLVAGVVTLISSWLGMVHQAPPPSQVATSTEQGSVKTASSSAPDLSTDNWATTTFDGVIFSYPPDWNAQLESSDKSQLYLDITPSATDSPIVNIQVHSDSNSNSMPGLNSIEFASQHYPSAGLIEIPDICISSLNICAKVWQSNGFQTSDYPQLEYLIPIGDDVISISPALRFVMNENAEQRANVLGFLMEFLNAMSIHT